MGTDMETEVHFKTTLHDAAAEQTGRLEVDVYDWQGGEVYLEAIDETMFDGTQKRSVVICNPTEARAIADALNKAADSAEAPRGN